MKLLCALGVHWWSHVIDLGRAGALDAYLEMQRRTKGRSGPVGFTYQPDRRVVCALCGETAAATQRHRHLPEIKQ